MVDLIFDDGGRPEHVTPREVNTLPLELIDGIRDAMQEGLSGRQIVMMLNLSMQVWYLMEQFDQATLLKKVGNLTRVIEGSQRIERGRRNNGD